MARSGRTVTLPSQKGLVVTRPSDNRSRVEPYLVSYRRGELLRAPFGALRNQCSSAIDKVGAANGGVSIPCSGGVS